MLAAAGAAAPAAAKARPDHVVVIIEENHDARQIIGNGNAPYINSVLAATGLTYSNSHGTDHDSQPNYLELFSGANPGPQGINSPVKLRYPAEIDPKKDPAAAQREDHADDDITNAPFSLPNLGALLISGGFTFAGYSETQPAAGFTGYQFPAKPGRREYVRKHNPWVNWQAKEDKHIGPNELPSTANLPLSDFPGDFAKLPTVAIVIPNEAADMHDTVSSSGKDEVTVNGKGTGKDADGQLATDDTTIRHGDDWLKDHLDAYRRWATNHNSLLIVTWDENDFDFTRANNIATIVTGDPKLVKPGINSAYVNHFSLLRTLEDMYGLRPAGLSSEAEPLPHDDQGRLVPDH